ncbi:MAG: NifB/NifX family molybdenum-iron cluster-binding protein [Candidatus Thorarchaeota archaeon]
MPKVCVTATAPNLEAPVDPRFGRCSYFIIADSDSLEFEAVSNRAAMAAGGAGIRAAQTVSKKNVEAVITGNIGPNAYPALESAGIKIVLFGKGTVKNAIEQYQQGNLEMIKTPGPAHRGMGRGRGRRGRGGW